MIFTVTDLVKVIDGVPNVVVWDRDIQDGELAEAELAFFAQDLAGNVWNLGEYPEEYDGAEFLGAPSTWISGHDDAHPGIHMKASPQAGTGWYLQGSVRSIKFLDCARITGTNTDGALTPAERRAAHASTLALEKHAYQTNRLYEETQPAS